MSIVDGVGKLIRKAKDEASEMAQSARLTLDLRQLEGKRDNLYSKIGRRVYKKRDQLMDFTELRPIFSEIDQLEAQIQTKEAELRVVRGEGEKAPGEAEPAAPGAPEDPAGDSERTPVS